MWGKIGAVSGTRPFIVAWFALDAILGLFPPIYWAASGASPRVVGLPLSVFYFVAVGLFTSASLVVAYFLDEPSHPRS
jgi:hypothetical protein